MTRLDLPHVLRQRALASRRLEAEECRRQGDGARTDARSGVDRRTPTATRPPTVSYGDPVQAPHSRAPAARVAADHGVPDPRARRFARGGGLPQPAVHVDFEWLDEWLEPSFRGVPDVQPDVVRQGVTLEVVIGHRCADRYLRDRVARSTAGSRARRARTRSTRSSVAVATRVRARVLLRRGRLRSSSTAPAAASPGWLDRVVDSRSSTARSTASARSCNAARRGSASVQDGLVRRYALGIALGAAALLLYVVIWTGR